MSERDVPFGDDASSDDPSERRDWDLPPDVDPRHDVPEDRPAEKGSIGEGGDPPPRGPA
jgi:hypothetical protein